MWGVLVGETSQLSRMEAESCGAVVRLKIAETDLCSAEIAIEFSSSFSRAEA